MTYISALSFMCKLYNFENVPNLFIVRKLLTSIQRKGVQPDSRLPITRAILFDLFDCI